MSVLTVHAAPNLGAAWPAGTEILAPGAPRGLWLATRRTGIGASDALTVAGLNPHASRYELWADKLGMLPPQPETLAMRLGRDMEPILATLFTEQAGIPTTVTGTWQSRAWPWMLANPDRFTSDGAGLEIKTNGAWTQAADLWRDGDIPDGAEMQSQWCMAVTGAPHWWLIALIGGNDLHVRRLERDDRLIGELVRRSERFWNEHVTTGVAPPVDGHPATTSALLACSPGTPAACKGDGVSVDLGAHGLELAKRHAELTGQAETVAAELATIKNELRASIGDARYGLLPDGSRIDYRTYDKRGIDTTRLRQRHPDAAADCTTVTRVRALHMR